MPPSMAYGHRALLFSVKMIAVTRAGEDADGQGHGHGQGQRQWAEDGGAAVGDGSGSGSSAHQGGGRQLFCEKAPLRLCASLNRSPCYMRQNTCGPCLPRHRGQMGYANTQCHAVPPRSRAVDAGAGASAGADAGADAEDAAAVAGNERGGGKP